MQLSLWFIVCFWPQVWTCPAPWVMSLHTKRSGACWFAGALHMLVFLQSEYAYNTFSVYVYIYIHIVMCIMYVMCKYIFCRHMFLYYVVHMPIRPMFWCSGQTRLVWHIPNQGWPHSRAGHLCDWPEGRCISIRTPTWHSRGNAFVDCKIFFRLKVNVFLKLFLEGGELASRVLKFLWGGTWKVC